MYKPKHAVKKEKSISWYIKKADIAFSRFIRQKYADENGIVQCLTCPYRNHWKKLQNGHFCPRQHMATRFSEKNCHPQCYACNMFYGGRPDAYALRLQEKYGEGIIKELHDLARTTKQFTRQELKKLIKKYEKM